MKTKVLYLDPISYTGLAYYSYSYVETMAETGQKITYGHSDNWLLTSRIRHFENVCLYRGVSGKRSRYIKGINYFFSLLRVFIYSIKNRYDRIHFSFMEVPWLDLMVIVLLKVFKRNIILTIHEVDSSKGKGRGILPSKSIFMLADAIIVHNNATIFQLREMGIDTTKMILMPHGGYEYFNDKRISKSSAREYLHLSDKSHYILFFGGITERKGIPILLSAFKELAHRMNLNCPILIIIGKPLSSYNLAQDITYIKQSGLSEKIIMKNEFVSVEEAENWYKASDVVVLPYNSVCDSGVLRQAFTYGCPTIISNLPQFSDLTVHDENCLVFEVGNIVELSSLIEDLFANSLRAKRIGHNAMKIMEKDYSWKTIIKKVEHIYYQNL